MSSSRAARAAVLVALIAATVGCEDPPVITTTPSKGPTSRPTAATSASASAKPVASAAPSASSAPVDSATPAASATPATSASASAPPTASAAPSAQASAPAGSASPTAGPPPVPFEDFSGPLVKPPVKVGERAWVVVPVSGSWSAVKLTVAPAIDVTEDAVVVAQGDARYLVPAALAAKATAASGLQVGDPVMASAKGTRVFGRVVEPGAGKSKVRFKFASEVEVAELAHDELVKLDGTKTFGAPATWQDGKVLRPAQLIHASPARTWIVAGGRAHAASPTDVTVLPVPPVFTKGAPVTAARVDVMAPGVIFDVFDDGLRYEVKWDGGDDTATMTFESIVPRK